MPATPPSTATTPPRRPPARWRRALAAGMLLVSTTPAVAGARPREVSATDASAACANTSVQPTAHDATMMRNAIMCLINAVRAQHSVVALLPSRALNTSAMGHSHDMVVRDYFAHDTPSGQTPSQRMRRDGAPCISGCELGENIAWATGSYSTPAAIVAAWMASPGHRANILDPAFRYEGVGVANGSPQMLSHSPGGTTVTEDLCS